MKKTDRKNYLTILKRDYEMSGCEASCRMLIETVMPQLEEIRRELESQYGRPIVQYITSRVKTPESILNKLIRKHRSRTLQKAVETLHDLAGIRVVCSFQDDVYRVVKEIRKLPGLKVIKVKDYIAHPKPTGYRSIHIITDVLPCGQQIRLEIQVCSAAMNYWAMLDHQLSYKNSRMDSDSEKIKKMERELKSYSVEIANIDKKFLKIRKMIEKL